ncbi:hypothetical protein B484DRAFT_403100 [Ochromonadaceae sp. CCMP2298]|nr:hypothetical protein B484DRAFT_403100 [Ochromonadaceae sp. CCMP2298]
MLERVELGRYCAWRSRGGSTEVQDFSLPSSRSGAAERYGGLRAMERLAALAGHRPAPAAASEGCISRLAQGKLASERALQPVSAGASARPTRTPQMLRPAADVKSLGTR